MRGTFTLKVPHGSDHHHWADYAELQCLRNPDGHLAIADLVEDILGRRDQRIGAGDFESASPTGGVGAPTISPAADAKRQTWASDLLAIFRYRETAFKQAYPFTITDFPRVLRRRAGTSSGTQLYTYLLIASNLRCINKRAMLRITRAFEVLSREALNEYLGRAEVHLFHRASRYPGNIGKKIERLALDLGDLMTPDVAALSSNATGDAGADIVAWVPFPGDTAGRGNIRIFAQATCEEDWTAKQSEASGSAWRRYINFAVDPGTVVFIPFCFRGAEGRWFKPNVYANVVLVDRVRLISLLLRRPRHLRKILKERPIQAAIALANTA